MKVGKIFLILLFSLLLVSGCSSNTVKTGRVDKIDGSEVTVTLGELDTSSNGEFDQFPGEMENEMTSQPPNLPDGDMGTPPDKPDGETGTTPPDKPEENSDNSSSNNGDSTNQRPEMPGNGTPVMQSNFIASDETITINIDDSILEDLKVGSLIKITFGFNNQVKDISIISGQNSPSSFSSGDIGTSANTYGSDTELSDQTFSSSTADENALRIENEATVKATNITVDKSESSTNTDDSNFYGLNAGILVYDGSTFTIKDSKITTKGSGANALFSYGSGTVVNVEDTEIETADDNAGGIQTAGGGTTNAKNLTIKTSGNSSAAIRSDRGGGTVTVDGGTYETNGTGSPAIYSTADITVKNSTLTSNNSEAVVVEGKNSVELIDSNVTGKMKGTYSDNSENIQNVMIYQSMSGDADVGESSFKMTGGTLTSLAGDQFYVTNTKCVIELSDVTIDNSTETFLRVSGNNGKRGWGKAGSNGGTCTFKATDQTISGNIIVDNISSLDLTLATSEISGAINNENSTGNINVTLDDNSTWTLTGDSYITSFTGDYSQVDFNGYTLFVNGEAIN